MTSVGWIWQDTRPMPMSDAHWYLVMTLRFVDRIELRGTARRGTVDDDCYSEAFLRVERPYGRSDTWGGPSNLPSSLERLLQVRLLLQCVERLRWRS